MDIIKYVITAECVTPLHIGNEVGSKEEVLIHPVDDKPFVQASSIAGAFRSYYENYGKKENAKNLFGGMDEENADTELIESRIRFEDGKFVEKSGGVYMELRPHVSIDPETGSGSSSIVKGSLIKAGHIFNSEYIGAGAKIQFAFYVYGAENEQEVEKILKAFHAGEILLGGQKSNGCGVCKIEKALQKHFNMKDPSDRKLWLKEDALEETEYDNITDHLSGADLEAYAYEFIVDATTEGKMLIKAIAVEDYGDGASDAVNIKNARKEYVIPGSSLKGAVRNHMEQIAERLHQKTVIKDTFGSAGNGEDLGQSGNIIFRDTIIGDKEDNDRMPNDYRIHIDKFTGGVMNGSLFSEKATAGNVKLHILVKDCNHPEKTSALLILALRDLALGMYNLGSGYSIGRGFLNVKEICINALKDQKHAVIRYVPAGKCDDPDQIITMCLRSLQEVE